MNSHGPTTIHLSKSFKLDDTATLINVPNAQVSIEGTDNSISTLADSGNGTYYILQALLNTGKTYRLHIKTPNGSEYYSDYIKVKNNPPIDSVNWVKDNGGIRIFVNTHDPLDSSIYYRWNYVETWEIVSVYNSDYKYVNGHILDRGFGEQVFVCWKNNISSDIITGNTSRLISDIISQQSLIYIPNGSEKLDVRYSVLVEQYTLSKEAYNYYTLLKKNTQSLGSIFDAQPSELKGNIHCVSDPSENVIGYLTACAEQQARIFIDKSQVPWWYFTMDCQSKEVTNNPDSIAKYIPAYGVPYKGDVSSGFLKGYFISLPQCSDCTYRGGNTTKPDFW